MIDDKKKGRGWVGLGWGGREREREYDQVEFGHYVTVGLFLIACMSAGQLCVCFFSVDDEGRERRTALGSSRPSLAPVLDLLSIFSRDCSVAFYMAVFYQFVFIERVCVLCFVFFFFFFILLYVSRVLTVFIFFFFLRDSVDIFFFF